MRTRRIHVTGASGAGVTTLGRAIADAMALPHHDVDDYFWLPTDPPYLERRPAADRLRLMRELFLGRSGWILSGALEGWGDELAPLFDLVVYVTAPTDLRLGRLRQREAAHFGATAIAPGGWRHAECEAFVAWAGRYDEAGAEVRSRLRHESWLDEMGRPVLRVDGRRRPDELAQQVRAYFSAG